jgi:hypothetical protein
MQTMSAITSPEATSSIALPAAPAVWTSAHYFHRIHDPASFAWLNSLDPKAEQFKPQAAKCFGMDVVYLALDMLHWFPSDTVLAVPFLDAPPAEYFMACNTGGERWWCFVVLRKGNQPTALVSDVSPSVLLIAGLGLRETSIEQKSAAASRGRDFDYRPNAAVLCPMDSVPIRYQRLSPDTREYFLIREAGEPGRATAAPTAAGVHGGARLPETSAMEVSIGTPALGLRMRVNEDESLMRYLDSLLQGEGGAL